MVFGLSVVDPANRRYGSNPSSAARSIRHGNGSGLASSDGYHRPFSPEAHSGYRMRWSSRVSAGGNVARMDHPTLPLSPPREDPKPTISFPDRSEQRRS